MMTIDAAWNDWCLKNGFVLTSSGCAVTVRLLWSGRNDARADAIIFDQHNGLNIGYVNVIGAEALVDFFERHEYQCGRGGQG
jgi:hypothetical protein